MPEWKETVNLPRTDFPMKANLPTSEPEMLARWIATDLYGRIRARRAGGPKFVLHDGPPYANGNIHMGTALNKILKDFVVKSRSMAGFDAPFVVGFDCHGLPIELKVDRELGSKKREMTTAEFCRACRAYADRFIGTMTAQFQRLGVLGTWDAPYRTMDFRYQAAIARAFGRFVERGLVYKGKKPVHWCIHCRTALAEAEVEYADHQSPSIYVEFALEEASAADLAASVSGLTGLPVSTLIWTTTPWTIPSNLAVAFHPELDYGAYLVDGRAVIVAEALAASVGKAVGRDLGTPVGRMKGAALDRLRFRHPLYARESLGVLGTHVTLEAGTGAVHTAPGHGADDFITGRRYGLEIYAPVGPAGHFLDSVELFGGQRVFDANPAVEEALKARGRLWRRDVVSHQYPHCWRCHHPVIFLATSQWFIRMDGPPERNDAGSVAGFDESSPSTAPADSPHHQVHPRSLRAAALDEIDHRVRWIPAWGRDRIYNMVAHRPDWCISRQRAWGVPIPALDCTACGEAITSPAIVSRAAAVFEQHGADAWYERPITEFVPEGQRCPACGGAAFERELNILDVWFDSGSSHEAVLSVRPELTWPADIYLEGSDQHRGWFQSSLLVGLGTRGRAPFQAVLTHGFLIDLEGVKMSKSLGNSIEADRVVAESGADILRLWVSMSDYRGEIRVSHEILSRASEAYRKIRNTLRYLSSNLYDFNPATDLVDVARMEEVDRYILARYADVASRVLDGYQDFEYGTVFQSLNAFATVDLSAFYADVSKDRLYTFAPRSPERRSGQTAMYTMAEGLARLLAPILSFTADELWRHLPGDDDDSVHTALFPAQAELDRLLDRELLSRWASLTSLRERVLGEIEPLRKNKVIGSSLQAKVVIEADAATLGPLRDRGDLLPMLFIVSEVELRTIATVGSEPVIRIERAQGVKCDRCWRYVSTVSTEPRFAGVCGRCERSLIDAANG